MILLLSVLRSVISSEKIKRVKPISLHFSLFVFIFVYAFVGGLIFSKIERDATNERDAELQQQQHECIIKKLETSDMNVIHAGETANQTANMIADCFRQEVDIRSQWGYVTGTLYGFGIVTTLGYNRIAPITTTARLLCVLYGLFGIPITMIVIANLGQYFNNFACAAKKKALHFKLLILHFKRIRTGQNDKSSEKPVAIITNNNTDNDDETSTELISLALLFVFLLYIVLGSLFLPLLNGEFDFLNGIYYNFLVLTAIDFGALVPTRVEFLPITFLYVCVGLAITTLAIEVGSAYMKKLHNLGQSLKNVAQQKVWFGGKQLKVRDLLHAVGKKAGVDPSVIDNLDLENIVERTVAINEGREPPPDTNLDVNVDTDNIPQELSASPISIQDSKPASPDRDIENQPIITSTTLSDSLDRTPSIETINEKSSPFDLRNFIAIDVELPDEYHQLNESQQHLYNSIIVNQIQEETVTSDIIVPRLIKKPAPIMILKDTESMEQPFSDDIDDEEYEPKKFLEKKQKYGRDPKKLYETYQEEWNRLERLGKKRLGSRRRSVLASDRDDSNSTNSSFKNTRLETPNSRSVSPRRSMSPSLSRSQGSTKGAVQSAKEALQRRASKNLSSSPFLDNPNNQPFM